MIVNFNTPFWPENLTCRLCYSGTSHEVSSEITGSSQGLKLLNISPVKYDSTVELYTLLRSASDSFSRTSLKLNPRGRLLDRRSALVANGEAMSDWSDAEHLSEVGELGSDSSPEFKDIGVLGDDGGDG